MVLSPSFSLIDSFSSDYMDLILKQIKFIYHFIYTNLEEHQISALYNLNVGICFLKKEIFNELILNYELDFS
jgi:hypothetical protein